MIFLRNSSPVIGDENMPKVPSVAPRWPSADVVAQQSVRVIVLKPAGADGVAAMVLNQDQGCLRYIELAPALGFRGLEGAVGLRTRQTHRRFWSVVMTERRMIPGFLSLRKGKPDLTARPTPIPTQYISRRRDMLARSAQTGKVSQGKGEKRPRPPRPRPRRPRRARQYPTGAQLKRRPASPRASA